MPLTQEQKDEIVTQMRDPLLYQRTINRPGVDDELKAFLDPLARTIGTIPKEMVRPLAQDFQSGDCGHGRQTCFLRPVYEQLAEAIVLPEEVQEVLKAAFGLPGPVAPVESLTNEQKELIVARWRDPLLYQRTKNRPGVSSGVKALLLPLAHGSNPLGDGNVRPLAMEFQSDDCGHGRQTCFLLPLYQQVTEEIVLSEEVQIILRDAFLTDEPAPEGVADDGGHSKEK